MSIAQADDYFQEFVCARCGNCCRGEGYVRVTPADAARLAATLGLAEPEFRRRYTRPAQEAEHTALGDVWLIEKPGPARECIFLKGNACAVNPGKPEQCRGFPTKWRTPDVAEYCVGMRRDMGLPPLPVPLAPDRLSPEERAQP